MAELVEQFIPFRGFRTWSVIAGSIADSKGLPLLCLHGGPGARPSERRGRSALPVGLSGKGAGRGSCRCSTPVAAV